MSDREFPAPELVATIFVPTWNHLETTTRPCVESLLRFTDLSYRLVCIDNGSSDGTRFYLTSLASSDPRVQLILLEENLGWSGALTLALLRMSSASSQFFCLLNSDTILTPRWLSRLVGHLDRHPLAASIIPNERPDLSGASSPGTGSGALSGWPVLPSTRLAPQPPQEEGFAPGSLTPPRAATLDEVLLVQRSVEQRYEGQCAPAPPSGFCILLRSERRGDALDYLRDFEGYRSGKRDWRAFWRERRAINLVALDTYVHHTRAGSGGYYPYDRSE